VFPAALALVAVITCAAVAARGADADDLEIAPGPDGFVSTWLVLGPVPAPVGLRKSLDELGGWDPLGSTALAGPPRAGERGPGGRWQVVGGRHAAVRLETRVRGTVSYLAAVLRADTPRRVWLSTGSDGGLAVVYRGELVHATGADRSAVADTDLIALDVPAGDSLLVLRAWSRDAGRVRVIARFADEQHRRARGLRLVLPGAGSEHKRVRDGAASIGVERLVDLESGGWRALVWLDFDGGFPIGERSVARVSWGGPEAPAASEVEVDLSPTGHGYELLADETFAGERCPDTVRVELAGKRLSARVGVRMRDVAGLAGAARDLARAGEAGDLPRTSVESVEWRVDHLRGLVEDGDADYRYLTSEVRETAALAAALAEGRDPYADRRGEVQRRGYRSAVDGKLHHYALYVPPGWREKGDQRFGLVVALHGLNGVPMKTMQSLFGIPLEEGETKLHRARHPAPLGSAPMFAVAPEGFGNSGYHQYGERDVLEVIGRVAERYRIDPARIYVTGPSMGGIGAGAIPLRNPDLFAAAAPLCGYHSLANYSSLKGVPFLPWEEHLASFRSNADWAENGRHLPMYIVHGTRDNPRHSAILVERYKLLGYDVTYETPDAGHNVWDETYANRRIFTHFARYWKRPHPRRVTLRTARLRYNRSYWLRIDEATDFGAWAEIDGVWGKDGRVEITTENVAAFTVARDEELAGEGAPTPTFVVDGEAVPAGGSASGGFGFHRAGDRWAAGAPEPCRGPCKRPGLTGPIDDVFYEPLLFVYGTADGDETALARRLIEGMRRPRGGVTVDWPMEADVEVSDEDIAAHSLVIVGTPGGNSLLARIADRLPLRVDGGAIVAGGKRFAGERVAASFVYPNPLNPERYVLVHTAVTAAGLFYAGHLPTLLPDWVVYDGSSWGRAGGLVFNERKILAGGLFDRSWQF